MTTVDTSGKIVTSIMALELLESTELDYIDLWCIYRGVSRISGKDVHMYKGTGFAYLMYILCFHSTFKNQGGGVGGRFKRTP